MTEEVFLDNEFESLEPVVFANEVVYDLDSFGEPAKKHQRHLSPPPSFNDAIKQIPQQLQRKFEELLNGKIVGIWPVKQNILKK